ncbi:MAG: SMC-Scp complex subunit ScpB [Armatimonadota bacterium]
MKRKEDKVESTNITQIVALSPISETPIAELAETVRDRVVAVPLQSKESEELFLQQAVECMLFVSAEPLSLSQLADVLGVDQDKVESALLALEQRLDSGSGLQLMRVAGGYQLCTRPEYADYCAAILQPARKKLSKAALETLAIIAYRQPCTQPEIEAVRGVSVDGVIKTLLERGLIREAGRKQAPGRPILYATTREFLEYFGLNDISELPDIDEFASGGLQTLEAKCEALREAEGRRRQVDAQDDEEQDVHGGE